MCLSRDRIPRVGEPVFVWTRGPVPRWRAPGIIVEVRGLGSALGPVAVIEPDGEPGHRLHLMHRAVEGFAYAEY